MTEATPRKLTRREAEVVTLVAAGRTMVDIGKALTISPRTARFHTDNAKRKLNCANTAEMIAQAIVQQEITVQ